MRNKYCPKKRGREGFASFSLIVLQNTFPVLTFASSNRIMDINKQEQTINK